MSPRAPPANATESVETFPLAVAQFAAETLPPAVAGANQTDAYARLGIRPTATDLRR
jgi:hypothetical protein